MSVTGALNANFFASFSTKLIYWGLIFEVCFKVAHCFEGGHCFEMEHWFLVVLCFEIIL